MTDSQQSTTNIKRRIMVAGLWAILLLTIMVSCSQNKDYASHDQYTCPMHPTVIQEKPGTCPICRMDLVLKGTRGEVKITAELNYLLKPANAMIISSIKTVLPVEKEMDVVTEANGIITYDTRRFASLPIRFGGRIEKLFIRYNLQPVRKGQKILEIYSPELVTAQRELLYLLTSDKENSQLIESAKQKLKLLGISDSEINALSSSGQESYSFSVFSSVDGYVIEDAALASGAPPEQLAGSSMNGGMASGSFSNGKQISASPSNSELLTREGMYVSSGQVIFKVVNAEQVWAEFNVYQKDAASIKLNDPIQLTFDNQPEKIEAKVNFVQPFFKDGENFTKVRVYLSNADGKFRIGQLITASFSKSSGNSLWIPSTAKLDLGTKKIAFTKRRGVFRAKEITTSRQSGDWLEVLSGLEASDSLAVNAQFMVDSESFIKVRN